MRNLLVGLVGAPGCGLACALSLLLVSEWYSVGFFPDSKLVADYHFGSPAMLDNGGWIYESARVYSNYCLIAGLSFGASGLVFVYSVVKRSWRAIGFSYVVLLALITANQVIH